jgi:phosphate/sulfate permease
VPETPPPKKASIRQVVTTMFFALIAIGRHNTWHKDGATVSFAQVVVGAFVGLGVLVVLLSGLVWLATR